MQNNEEDINNDNKPQKSKRNSFAPQDGVGSLQDAQDVHGAEQKDQTNNLQNDQQHDDKASGNQKQEDGTGGQENMQGDQGRNEDNGSVHSSKQSVTEIESEIPNENLTLVQKLKKYQKKLMKKQAYYSAASSKKTQQQLSPQQQRQLALQLQIIQIRLRINTKHNPVLLSLSSSSIQSPEHSRPQQQEYQNQFLTSSQSQQQQTIDRLNHLQFIFKHYCTHIFKTGKHMTFDRLQYEKIHLTMDRFFVFLKDFGLMVMKVDKNKEKQIVQKSDVVKIFKMVSTNCKDLNFEQFIVCLEKLAVLYYDCKVTYYERKEKYRKEREKVKEIIEKKERIKRELKRKHEEKQAMLEKGLKTEEQQEGQQEEEGREESEQESNQQQENKSKSTDKNFNKNENDDVIEGLMEEDKNQEQKLQAGGNNQAVKSKDEKAKAALQLTQEQNRQLNEEILQLPNEQKVEYFYQLINVDNVASFRKKLGELNLPHFQKYQIQQQQEQKEKEKDNKKGKTQAKNQEEKLSGSVGSPTHNSNSPYASHLEDHRLSSSIRQEHEKQQQNRLLEVRSKLQQRQSYLKHSNTMGLLSKQQYEKRKKKREQEQSSMRDQQMKNSRAVHNGQKKKKVDITESEINLSSLSKLAYDNVNFVTKFPNPRNLYSYEEEDDIFMKEYMGGDSPYKSHKKIGSNGNMSSIHGSNANIINTGNTKPTSIPQPPSSSSKMKKQLYEKDRSSQSFLNKMKKQHAEIQSVERQKQVSQMYRFNDRTQRQKRLIDKFLEKNNGGSNAATTTPKGLSVNTPKNSKGRSYM